VIKLKMYNNRGNRGPPPGYGVPDIEEVDEEGYEDLQLYPFDEPTEEDVLWMCQIMGIHPIRDKAFMYLANEALLNPPSEEWMIFKDIAGNVIWINEITEDMEPHPPHLKELIDNFQRVKKKSAMMESRASSNDKSNAMKKILGRNLTMDVDAVPEEPAKKEQEMSRPKGREMGGGGQNHLKKGGGMNLLKAIQFSQEQEAAPKEEKLGVILDGSKHFQKDPAKKFNNNKQDEEVELYSDEDELDDFKEDPEEDEEDSYNKGRIEGDEENPEEASNDSVFDRVLGNKGNEEVSLEQEEELKDGKLF
jgi:hypothetical protein